jgi:gas vesicle protein
LLRATELGTRRREEIMADGEGHGDVIVAFLVGAVAGAAAALLVSPNRGSENREAIADGFRSVREYLGNLLEERGIHLGSKATGEGGTSRRSSAATEGTTA